MTPFGGPNRLRQDIWWMGVVMFVGAYAALWACIVQLAQSQSNPYIAGLVGLLVGVSGLVLGEIRRSNP